MTYALQVHLDRMKGQLDQVVRDAVAAYRLDLSLILFGTGVEINNPFPLYWPGMPAYDRARDRRMNE